MSPYFLGALSEFAPYARLNSAYQRLQRPKRPRLPFIRYSCSPPCFSRSRSRLLVNNQVQGDLTSSGLSEAADGGIVIKEQRLGC